MYACCAHAEPLPARTNTYTAPALGASLLAGLPPTPVAAPSSRGAPTASVVPLDDSAADQPNRSNSPGFDALKYPIASASEPLACTVLESTQPTALHACTM